ncbi:MAG: macro domain-containing protein [Archangium sp.]|nr:macro domain-containing protein [Archangium sp.]
MTIEIIEGSITKLDVDAIVNAANATLAGGGGVDGAIHKAAGPELKAACLSFPQLRSGVRCEVGEAKVTPGFLLPARYVIHTVGPFWSGGEANEPELLARCYRSALAEVTRLGLSSVAFPAISTGAFGYPALEAAKIAVREARAHPELRVVFSCLGVAMVRQYERALATRGP